MCVQARMSIVIWGAGSTVGQTMRSVAPSCGHSESLWTSEASARQMGHVLLAWGQGGNNQLGFRGSSLSRYKGSVLQLHVWIVTKLTTEPPRKKKTCAVDFRLLQFYLFCIVTQFTQRLWAVPHHSESWDCVMINTRTWAQYSFFSLAFSVGSHVSVSKDSSFSCPRPGVLSVVFRIHRLFWAQFRSI